MAPVYRVRNPDATYTDITSYFRLYKLDVATNAEEGSVAQSTITAHDPTGTFDIVGHRQIRIHEDTATGSNTMIYVGFIGDRRITRGPNRTTTGRDWEIDLLDPNSILARRILTGADSNRPAETDVARIQWLVSTNESGMVNDSLYVQTAGPVNMDAKDYTGQRFNEVIDDCAQASGKNYHLWWRESTGTFSLWYDFASSTSQTSPLRLTNVDTEVDNVLTFAISNDTQLTRSPDRVNSGVYLPYEGGVVYTQDGTTSNLFARRDVVMPAENVKTLAKASARADRYLTTMNNEDDVITTTVVLPAAKVNFLKEGMRVQTKATHLPGYEAYSWARAMNRSVLQVSEDYYAVKVELSVRPPSLCAGGTYAETAAGTYAPLNSGTTNALAVVYYLKPGVGTPEVPTPSFLGDWNFPTYGSGGSQDVAEAAYWPAGNSVRLIVVGDGTMVVTMVSLGGTQNIGVTVSHDAAPTNIGDSSQVGSTAAPITVVVRSHNGANCVHMIDLGIDGPVTSSHIGFAGATWTPAA